MKIVKLCGLVILLILLGGWLISLWYGFTLYAIVHEEPKIKLGQKELAKGDILSPLEGLDFNQGKWTAYLIISAGDFERLKGKFSRNCLKLTDRETMKRMQDEWKMIYMGGDMVTVRSRIIFFKDDKVVFSSGIVLTEGGLEGLQSGSFGWIVPQDKGALWKYCRKFEPVYWPIVIL